MGHINEAAVNRPTMLQKRGRGGMRYVRARRDTWIHRMRAMPTGRAMWAKVFGLATIVLVLSTAAMGSEWRSSDSFGAHRLPAEF